MKRSAGAEQLVKTLSRHGYRFQSFALQSTGKWTTDDADWNYKDVPHLNIVHSRVKTVPAVVDDALIANIFMQKVCGVPMPIVVPNYVSADETQVYFTSLLWFILIVETRANDAADAPTETTVVTTYHVGSPPLLGWTFPLIRRLLTSNYRVLMSEDLPMRERRGELRRSGFRFRTDGRPRSFSSTMDLTRFNVEPPQGGELHVEVDLNLLDPNGGSTVIGSDPGGFRLVRNGNVIDVFDRVCWHEGAALDNAQLVKGCLKCPWHGRLVKPVATLDLSGVTQEPLDLGQGTVLTVEGSQCTVNRFVRKKSVSS